MSEISFVRFLCFVLLAISAKSDAINEKIFNVLDYGAKMHVKVDNGPNFNRAWQAACHSNAKARLLIPKGVFYTSQVNFQGPCTTRGPIIVHFQGTVKADADSSSFPNMQWIMIEYLNNAIFIGTGGLLDGQGASSWKYTDCDDKNLDDCLLPPSNVYIYQSSNIFFRNLTSINPKGNHFQIDGSDNVNVHGVRLSAPKDASNTNGFRITNSTSVTITKSVISSGGECVSFGPGSVNIVARNITCTYGRGMSVGYLGKEANELEVNNISVRTVTLSDTEYGVRVKPLVTPNPNLAQGITFQDIVMNNVKHPIFPNPETGHGTKYVKISNVHFANISGTTALKVGVTLKCSEESSMRC